MVNIHERDLLFLQALKDANGSTIGRKSTPYTLTHTNTYSAHTDAHSLTPTHRHTHLHSHTVGIFGAGHIPGILDFWDEKELPSREMLLATGKDFCHESIESWLRVHPLPSEELFLHVKPGAHSNGTKRR